MSDQCQDTLRCDPENLRQAMSIHTRKITDSCRDKDCIEDLPVYLTASSQALLESSAGARVRSAELISTYMDVEPVAFDRKHYCIDVTFYYQIIADTIVGTSRPAALTGLAVFSKRAVLCGEDSSAHIYRSDTDPAADMSFTSRPTAVAEVLDPMVLGSQVKELSCGCTRESTVVQIPDAIKNYFEEELSLNPENRRMYVTLGQFSIIRLERDAQLIVPVLDYSIPTKECCDNPGCAEDPCEMFSRIPFPASQFMPKGCDQQKNGSCCTAGANG